MMVGKEGAKGKGKWKGKKKIGSKDLGPSKPAFKKASNTKGGFVVVAGKPYKGNCHWCKEKCHWKRNCPAYLESLKKMKYVQIQDSGIFVIEVNLSCSTSWVLDTGHGSHICINVHKLQRSRSLAKGEIDLRVGNGAKVDVLDVGTYYLSLPSGLVLKHNECLYVPAI